MTRSDAPYVITVEIAGKPMDTRLLASTIAALYGVDAEFVVVDLSAEEADGTVIIYGGDQASHARQLDALVDLIARTGTVDARVVDWYGSRGF